MAKVGSPGQGGRYTYNQLRNLWLNAGGNKGWSYVMAAIAMAESGGNPRAHNVDANGSVDYGLWQINSVHGYSPQSSYNPQQNAKQAVSVFNSSGPAAWSTYKNGAYKKYLPSGKTTPSSVSGDWVDPVPGAGFERIDQGVDYIARTPVRAITGGKIVAIHPFAQGEGVASHTQVVEKFDKPIKVGANTYYGGYYAEETPLVKPGQKVKAGDPVMKAGSDEIGFLVGSGLAMPPLVGGLGAGTQPTQPGKDYAGIVTALGGPKAPGETNPAQALLNSLNVAGSDPIQGAINTAKDAFSLGGVKALAYQMLFGLVGVILIVAGLGLIAWAIMGRVGAPGIIGMAQQQMRINQASLRTQESQRASMVRESQAAQRIEGQGSQRQLSERRLSLQEKQVERRESEPTNIIYPVQHRTTRTTRGKYQ